MRFNHIIDNIIIISIDWVTILLRKLKYNLQLIIITMIPT